ncbi:MAG: SEC-C metal-binding domain-containing protein, partial [Acidimicrobiia bacterium]
EQRDHEAEVAALRQLVAHPCAAHEVDLASTWDDLHQALRRLDRYDEAIEAKQEAIAAGYRSEPDPRADIAECHVLAGRVTQGEESFVALRDENPDDVWLYNSAALTYAEAGDHPDSERWAREGIETALRTGDPDQVIDQLLDIVQAARSAQGVRPDTELVGRVNSFIAGWKRPPRSFPAFEPSPPPRPCAHCGFDPETPPPSVEEGGQMSEVGAWAMAWFPPGEWAKALSRWPDLAEYHPVEDRAYARQMEGRIKATAELIRPTPMAISPLSVEALVERASDLGADPGDGETRASLAAELARRGEAIPWPPGRNQPCWCGSGVKYKKCCGPEPPAGPMLGP